MVLTPCTVHKYNDEGGGRMRTAHPCPRLRSLSSTRPTLLPPACHRGRAVHHGACTPDVIILSVNEVLQSESTLKKGRHIIIVSRKFPPSHECDIANTYHFRALRLLLPHTHFYAAIGCYGKSSSCEVVTNVVYFVLWAWVYIQQASLTSCTHARALGTILQLQL